MKKYNSRTMGKSCSFPVYSNDVGCQLIASQWANTPQFSLQLHDNENSLWQQVHLDCPSLVILGVDRSMLSNSLIRRLSSIAHRPTIISVIRGNDESLLIECYAQGSDRVLEETKCSAKIFQALIERIFIKEQNNPLRKEHCFPPYCFNTKLQTFNFDGSEVRLTKKTFDLVRYLFVNHGNLVPKSKILKDLWGLDSAQCFTRRVDAHISLGRKLLALDGSYGWEIKTRNSTGCGIFRSTDV